MVPASQQSREAFAAGCKCIDKRFRRLENFVAAYDGFPASSIAADMQSGPQPGTMLAVYLDRLREQTENWLSHVPPDQADLKQVIEWQVAANSYGLIRCSQQMSVSGVIMAHPTLLLFCLSASPAAIISLTHSACTFALPMLALDWPVLSHDTCQACCTGDPPWPSCPSQESVWKPSHFRARQAKQQTKHMHCMCCRLCGAVGAPISATVPM